MTLFSHTYFIGDFECLIEKTSDSVSLKLQGIKVHHITDVTNYRSFLIVVSVRFRLLCIRKYKIMKNKLFFEKQVISLIRNNVLLTHPENLKRS